MAGDTAMKRSSNIILVAVFLMLFSLILTASAQQSCDSLKTIKIPNVTITSVEKGAPGYELAVSGLMNMPARKQKINAPFCRIIAVSKPTSDSDINIEIWLPDAANWNGRFLAVGNPGFIGSIASGGIASNMEKGYVSAGTDTGHLDPGFEWAIGHPEKWADWGHRAVHEMTVATKTLAKAYYGKPIDYSYWNSCHNGGNQGLNEAQRYPEDYDGIIAEDPAFYISHLQPGSLFISWLALKDGIDGPGYIPVEKLEYINKAALAACDGNDGLVDGLIEDPTACDFDPASIQCSGEDALSCLTAGQVDTVRKIYEGAKFKDGAPIYTGFERGSELTWAFMIEKEPFSVNLNYFKGMVYEDPDWDFRTFDLERDTHLGIKKTAEVVDANNPDLKPFKDAGGKIMMVSSWNSLALPPRQFLKYYQDVEKTMGGAGQTRSFARFFSVPGSNGCPAFANPDGFKTFDALQAWVEEGKAPERIIYPHTKGGGMMGMGDGGKLEVYRTRPVCAYPKQARYIGTGDINDAANFKCVDPKK